LEFLVAASACQFSSYGITLKVIRAKDINEIARNVLKSVIFDIASEEGTPVGILGLSSSSSSSLFESVSRMILLLVEMTRDRI